jgi:Fe2+ or Zn2+ uptake regulation protein
MNAYFNTTHAEGPQLKMFERKATTQEQEVYDFLRTYRQPAGASLIWQQRFTRMTPITSVRRALTCLCTAGKIKKLNQLTPGFYGRSEYLYQAI